MVLGDFMKLYKTDYSVKPQIESSQHTESSQVTKRRFGSIFNEPIELRHYNSLFPNNHILLMQYKKDNHITDETNELTEKFYSLIHDDKTKERDILNFINKTPAYHIIMSILNAGIYMFGNHGTYLFPEFPLGNTYRADYLIIGKSSGGYDFLFVELESPNGSVTIKNGQLGVVYRKGQIQIYDWQNWIEGNFDIFSDYLNTQKGHMPLPIEFVKYDSTRFHYAVVAGLRSDYDETTYRLRRKETTNNLLLLHYDNLYDAAIGLNERNTF